MSSQGIPVVNRFCQKFRYRNIRHKPISKSFSLKKMKFSTNRHCIKNMVCLLCNEINECVYIFKVAMT